MLRVWLMVLVIALLIAVAPGAVRAAQPDEQGAAGHKDADKAHPGTGAAGEDKNPLAPVLDLTIWTSIVFLLMLAILYWLAWKPLLQALKHREDNIRTALEEAQQARAESQRLREQFEAERAAANEQVRRMLDEGRRDADRLREEITSQARTEIQAERGRLLREIETAKDQALAQIAERGADLATVISSKLLKRQVNLDDHRRLVDEAMADLESAGRKRASVIESVV
jgi:F-type H+-transporting ATPase subunit b